MLLLVGNTGVNMFRWLHAEEETETGNIFIKLGRKGVSKSTKISSSRQIIIINSTEPN